MKFLPVLFFVCVLIALSCNSHPKEIQPAEQKKEDTAAFYPLNDFLKEQIRYVDLRNFPLYKITEKNGKKDSSAITKEQFIEWAGVFLTRETSFSKTKISYRESVFNDRSTGSVTLNYQSVDSKTEVQNIDVLLDEQTQIVKRVFIRSEYARADTIITEQCNWKADKSFQVNRTFTTKNGYHSTECNYINWNDKQ